MRAAPAVYARPLSLLGGPGPGLGAALQGAHAAKVQGQILLNSHSFDTYTKADPAAARCLSNTLNVRDTLSIALHTAASVLVNLSSIAHASPLYAPLMDLAQAVESVLPGTKEVVQHLSQKMLFQGREIGPIALQLREDLAVYNALNPESPLTSKEYRDLQNMSKPEFRQIAPHAPAAGEGPGRAGARLRNPFPRWTAPAVAAAPGPQMAVGLAYGAAGVQAQGPRNLANVLCFNCQTLGHYANQCLQPRARPAGPPPPRPWYTPTLPFLLFLPCSSVPFLFSLALTFLFLPEYVQCWIDGFLVLCTPVSDDLVLRLSELASTRLSLDALLQEWISLDYDWADETVGRSDHLTTRQHAIQSRRPALLAEITSTHSVLSSSCLHPGYAPPPFVTLHSYTIPPCFGYTSLCILCLSPPPCPGSGPPGPFWPRVRDDYWVRNMGLPT